MPFAIYLDKNDYIDKYKCMEISERGAVNSLTFWVRFFPAPSREYIVAISRTHTSENSNWPGINYQYTDSS